MGPASQNVATADSAPTQTGIAAAQSEVAPNDRQSRAQTTIVVNEFGRDRPTHFWYDVFMPNFIAKRLDASTWQDFAALVTSHNGVWGGCWCMSFHPEGAGQGKTAAQNCAEKERRVCAGTAHAALVFDGTTCIGWCQFGSPEELPRIKNQRAYLQGLTKLPDWRITCLFVD